MSKVNYYYGTKQKAIHRMKRYETRMWKYRRFKNYKNDYYCFCGYFPKDFWDDDCKIMYKASKNAKIYKKCAAKQLRRHADFDEDAKMPNGSTYKKDYDLKWELW